MGSKGNIHNVTTTLLASPSGTFSPHCFSMKHAECQDTVVVSSVQTIIITRGFKKVVSIILH